MLSSNAVEPSATILADFLQSTRNGGILVITGAGASLASGIPTFRGTDPSAVWKRDITELGTNRYFREDPVGSWAWYLSRFEKVLAARPNPTHFALAALEKWAQEQDREFLLITQNIDTLHEDAGSRRLIKVHGSADRIRCARYGCRLGAPRGSLLRSEFDLEPFLAAPSLSLIPRCPQCGDLLRQHVLWFDEYYTEHEDYQFDRAQRALADMAGALFVGTSFSVGITEMVLQAGRSSDLPMISIDPSSTPPGRGVTHLQELSEQLLPEVCRRIGVPLTALGATFSLDG
ncbi:MAG: hypothetical protein K0U98_17100 [Deltaproteobacteria bacterium]|nr:hypothetical protein [Deltaproteobacteria bacterium]